MKIGDKYIYEGLEYTILEIEDNVLHLIDANGNGICIIK